MDHISTKPRVFISYSHSSTSYKDLIRSLAEQLCEEGGIDVVLDQWDLQPGDDAYKYMEEGIRDSTISKVILCCDPSYVEKANDRRGGVGVEAQIVTPELYSIDRNKFIPVIMERGVDGSAVPRFAEARIYIDMSSPVLRAENFSTLVRALWDKPLHVKPKVGSYPESILDVGANEYWDVPEQIRALEQLSRDSTYRYKDALEKIVSGIVEKIAELQDTATVTDDDYRLGLPCTLDVRRAYESTVSLIMRRGWERGEKSVLTTLIESLLKCAVGAVKPAEDAIKLLVHECIQCTIAIALRGEYYEYIQQFFDRKYIFTDWRGEARVARIWEGHFHSERLARSVGKQQRHSIVTWYDLESRRASEYFNESDIIAADMVLFLRALFNGSRWFPQTVKYASYGRSLEWFVRLRHSEDRVAKEVIGVESVKHMDGLWRDHRHDTERMMQQLSFYYDVDIERMIALSL